MRTAIALVLVAGSCLAVMASSGSTVTAGQLALMPLTKAELGPDAAFLPLDPDSGVQSNAIQAHDANESITAATFGRLGRLTGYELDYDDQADRALTVGDGLLEINSEVDVYRNAAAAHSGLAFERRDGLYANRFQFVGFKAVVSPAAAKRVGDETFALRSTLVLTGKPNVRGLTVAFRLGSLLAVVDVTQAGGGGPAMSDLAGLAQELEIRIKGVLNGSVKGLPVALPAKVTAGPPPNGQDLSKLALAPSDVFSSMLTHSGYRLDHDLNPLSDYQVKMTARGPFTSLSEDVEQFASPTAASVGLLSTYGVAATPGFFERLVRSRTSHVASVSPTLVPIRYGDESKAVRLKATLTNGVYLYEGFIFIRIGPILETVFVSTGANGSLTNAELDTLASAVAARARVGIADTR
jgi:hypothetical protein